MLERNDTILLVEDDEVDVMQVRRAFRKKGIHNPLQVAGDGIEALKILRDESDNNKLPKVVLLDINMPRMNGIEFLKNIRQDEKLKQLFVFILTTSANDEDVVNAHSLNVAGYILKPVTFQKFLDALDCLETYWDLNQIPSH